MGHHSGDTSKFILLLSGSPSFLEQHLTGCSQLSCVYAGFDPTPRTQTRRPRQSSLPWYFLHHTELGGATDFTMLLTTNGNLDQFPRSKLRRTLGHFIDFGICPLGLPLRGGGSFLSVSSLLPVSNIYAQIKFPTHFFWSGWGRRSLTFDELGTVFGFTAAQRPGLTEGIFPCPPIQLCSSPDRERYYVRANFSL